MRGHLKKFLRLSPRVHLLRETWKYINCPKYIFRNLERSNQFSRLRRNDLVCGHIAKKPMSVKDRGLRCRKNALSCETVYQLFEITPRYALFSAYRLNKCAKADSRENRQLRVHGANYLFVYLSDFAW